MAGQRAKSLSYCGGNLKTLATACEMYSTDNVGLYPKSLDGLMPKYLPAIPPCPGAGQDTYTRTYQFATVPDSSQHRR